MKLTNRYGLPAPIERAVARDPYSRGNADFSVTQLIDSPQIGLLKERHADDLVRDVSEMVWSLLGRGVHAVLEEAAQGDAKDRKQGQSHGEHLAEARFYLDVAGARVSGGVDLIVSGARRIVTDYKVTSAYNVQNPKASWEQQLNAYAYLVSESAGMPVHGVQVVAIVRDWMRRRIDRDDTYPPSPLVVVPIPLWSKKKQRDFLHERVTKHLRARSTAEFNEALPPCTDDERWMRPATYAVMAPGKKRALKIFNSEEEAVSDAEQRGEGTYVEPRGGEPIRCQEYCEVAPFCQQWNGEIRAGRWKHLAEGFAGG